jgi:hypothetical protein
MTFMKIILHNLQSSLLLLLFGLLSSAVFGQYTITGNVNSSTLSCGTFSGNTIIYVGDGTSSASLIMDQNLNLTTCGLSGIQFVIRNNATLVFPDKTNNNLSLPANSSIVIDKGTPGGNISTDGSCSASDLITIGGTKVAACQGGSSLYTFAQIVENGGYNFVNATASPSLICGSGSSTITATSIPASGATYMWYSAATGGTLLQNGGNVFNTNTISSTTTYYVEASYTSPNYTTTRRAVTITVSALPTVTTVIAPATICQGSSATITLGSITGTGSSYKLYTVFSGGTSIGVVPQTLSPTITTTYYVAAVSSAGCESLSRKAVSITVNSLVDNTGTGFRSSSFCKGEQATITFDANNGSGKYPYTLTYRNETTGTVFSQIIADDDVTSFDLNPNPIATTNFTLLSITDSNGCVNLSPTKKTATATIRTLPAAPIAATPTQPTCFVTSGSVVLSGLPATAWTIIASPATVGLTGLTGTGTSSTIGGLEQGITYTFALSNGTCASMLSTPVVINPVVTTTYNGSSWSDGTGLNKIGIIAAPNATPIAFEDDTELCSCTVKPGTTVNVGFEGFGNDTMLRLQDKLVVEGGGKMTFFNGSSLVQINDNAVNSGSINYERETTPISNFDYTYWSSPVTGQKLIDFSPKTLGDKFLSFDSFVNNWKYENAYVNFMNVGTGYIIRGPQDQMAPKPPGRVLYKFTGMPNNGIVSLPLGNAGNYALIGNPYSSALNADKFLDDNAEFLEGTIYFWTHNTSIRLASSLKEGTAGSGAYAYTSDDYAAYNRTGGVGTAAPSASSPNTSTPTSGPIANESEPKFNIGSGQSFFAIIKKSGDIKFNNSMRVGYGSIVADANGQFFKQSSVKKVSEGNTKNRLWLDLINDEGAFKETLLGYITSATNSNESAFDGESFNGNAFIDFYSINDNRKLTIQGRSLPFDQTDEVPLGYKTAIEGKFSIKIRQFDGLFDTQKVFIQDKLLHIKHDLKKEAYTFTTTKGTFDDRFVLFYPKATPTIATSELDEVAKIVLVSATDKGIKVTSSDSNLESVMLYDLSGKEVFNKQKINSSELSVRNIRKGNTIYVVKIKLNNGQTRTQKVIY